MPNRIIKESICYSDDIDKLTPFEETVFYRLIVRCDDYGRLDARPAFLRSMLFVTKKGITEKNVEEAVARLASLGLVRFYEVDGKSFLMFPKWHLHQRPRDSKEKYPPPPDDGNLPQNSCPPSLDDLSPQVAASCRESRPVSQSQAVSQAVSQTQAQAQAGADMDCPANRTANHLVEVVSFLNLTCGTNYRVSSEKTKRHINARLNEGYTLDDFKTVILRKHAEWHTDPKMSQYLRPETLFGTKFESYLNAPDRAPPQSVHSVLEELFFEAKEREQHDP